MPSRSQRFGPRIGGWRDRPSVVATRPLTNADIVATAYLARWVHPDGTGTQWMVLAMDAEEAYQCARLRAAHTGLDITGAKLDLTPMHHANQDTHRAILDVECADEFALRNTPR